MNDLNDTELQQEYLKLVRNVEVDKLELALNEPNIFSILSIENMEIRHSNFLGWLLSPRESHGLGDAFLKRFLREIFIDAKCIGFHTIDAEMLNYQQVEIRREWKHIDLLIVFPEVVICIENKIWSSERSGQLGKYKDIINAEFPGFRKAFVYLTPYGNESSIEQETYSFISYQHIIEILERILEVKGQHLSKQALVYIEDYCKSLNRNIMGKDTTKEIAQNIYRNHKKLIDFIYANRPNPAIEYATIGKELILEQKQIIGSDSPNFVRFLSPEINDLIPRYKYVFGWPNGEAMLYELQFNDRDVTLKIALSPAEDDRFRKKILELLESKIKIDYWQNWIILGQEVQRIDYSDPVLNRTGVVSQINVLLNKLRKSIAIVESTLLAHREELIALKNQIENY